MDRGFSLACAGRRSSVLVLCSGGLRAKGKRHLARDITVRRILGEGSFGQVYEGTISTPNGDERVVLKRTKTQIPGATEMAEMEHVLNVYASRVCRDSVVDFIGYCGVNSSEANRNLTPGTWLLWKYQGDKTLATYMRRRDTIPALAQDLNVDESKVARVVLKQILTNLQGLHKAGLVHRDVKPSNLVLCEEDRIFKFIDLGACADLRLGTNYVPDESILDAVYCPPEQYVLPTDAPELSKNVLAMVISPMLWSKHKPDRFDVYSAGLIFLQLAVPVMCSDRAIKNFASTFPQHDHDLERWRAASKLQSRHTEVLDAMDGAGWKLLEQMLKPRNIKKSKDGTISFVESDDVALRISVEQALNHEFFTSYVEPTKAPLFSLWQRYSRKLFDLEGRILSQVVETEQQTTTVKKLRSQVEKGEVSKQELVKEEKKLSSLQGTLKNMTQEFVSVSKSAFERFGVKKRVDTNEEEIIQTVEDCQQEEEQKKGDVTSKPRSLLGWFRNNQRTQKTVDGDRKNTSRATVPGTAENLIYIGLKFTGLAAKVATDLAASVKQDAEKLLKEIEHENMEKNMKEKQDREYLELLKRSKINASSTFDAVERSLWREDSFQALPQERRKILFTAYARALEEQLRIAENEAEMKLKALYEELGIHHDSRWGDVAESLSENAVFNAVTNPSIRKKIFKEIQQQQKHRHSLELAEKKAESKFRTLLKELKDPPITGFSSWPRVKQQIFADERYQTLSENRRVALFDEYRSIVLEVEKEERETDRLAELKKMKERASRETAAAEKRLMELKNERQRIKEQYEKMQMNLEAMESKLNSHRQVLPTTTATTTRAQSSQQIDRDGHSLYKPQDSSHQR